MTRDHLQNPSLAERNRHTSCFCSSVCEEPLPLFVLHVPTCLLAGSPSPPRTAWLRAGFPHEIRWGQRCNGYSQDPAFLPRSSVSLAFFPHKPKYLESIHNFPACIYTYIYIHIYIHIYIYIYHTVDISVYLHTLYIYIYNVCRYRHKIFYGICSH